MLACRQAAGTECQTVMLVRNGTEEPADILGIAHDARQSKDGIWRVVGMHAHIDVVLLTDGHDSLQPVLHVRLQLLLADAFIQLQQFTELLHGSGIALLEVARDEALRLDDDVLHQCMVALRRGFLRHGVSLSHEVASPVGVALREGCPVLAGFGTLQDIDVEIGKGTPVHVEVRRTVGILVQQVGASPVQHGHEVIADTADALLAEVAQRLLIHLYLLVAVGTAVLDGLRHGQTLHHAPRHAVALDILLEFVNLLTGPHLTEGNVVQGGDDALYSNLSQLGKGDLILLAKPSPCSFHILLI